MKSGKTSISDELLALNKKLLKAGKKDANKFLYAFLDREDAIIGCLKQVSGVKSEIYLREVDRSLGELLRLSSLFSDITLLNTANSAIKPSELTHFSPESEYWRDRKLTFPRAYLPEVGTDPSRFTACYINRQDAEIKKLFSQYGALVKNGRLLIRPLRGLYVGHPEIQQGTLYYVDQNTENDHWFIDKSESRDQIVIDNGLDKAQMVKLFELTLPYFDGIEIDTLAKVLNDESDSISSFRAQLKKMVQEAGDNLDDLHTLQEDTIRPAIDTLERKFKAISGTHRLSVVGTLGTYMLTLVVATINGNLMQALGAGIPFAGGAILLSERNYAERLDGIKDNPFYLLWRIHRNIR